MAGAGNAAGVYSDLGGVSERHHGDAHSDSRARSDNAESRWQECFRGEPNAAVAWAAAARGGPDLQRPANQRGGASDTNGRLADEGVATGARGAEPGATAIADSAAGRQFAASFA